MRSSLLFVCGFALVILPNMIECVCNTECQNLCSRLNGGVRYDVFHNPNSCFLKCGCESGQDLSSEKEISQEKGSLRKVEDEETEVNNEIENCGPICAEICIEMEGKLTPDCLGMCPCTCDMSCKEKCPKYDNQTQCLIQCGCTQYISQSQYEVYAKNVTLSKDQSSQNNTTPSEVKLNQSTSSTSIPPPTDKQPNKTIPEVIPQPQEPKKSPAPAQSLPIAAEPKENTANNEKTPEEKKASAMKCLDTCVLENPGNTENIAQCLTQCATKNENFRLLGCVVQCSITSWTNPSAFILCSKDCLADETTPLNTVKLLKSFQISTETKEEENSKVSILIFLLLFIGITSLGIYMLLNRQKLFSYDQRFRTYEYEPLRS